MTPRVTPRTAPSAWPARLALLAILVATTLLRLRLAAVPLERDEGEYAYMGRLILAGEVPYLAAHNMKLPGTYYAYAAVMAVLGETDVAIRLGLLAVNLLAIVLVYLLGRMLVDRAAGLGAAVIYAVLSLGEPVLGFSAKAEHFVIVPMLAGVLVLARPDATRRMAHVALAGVLLGIAVLMKQHGAAFVVFGGLYLLARGLAERRAWGTLLAELALFGVAAVAPFGLTCAAMAAAGAFEPFWFWTVTYAGEYAVLIPLDVGLGALRTQLGRLGGAAPLPWALALLGATALAWDLPARRAASFLALFAACSFAAVVPGLRFSEQYFLLVLPAASLLAGTGASAAARRLGAHRPALHSALAAGLPALAAVATIVQARALLFTMPPAAVARAVYGVNPFPEAPEIARYLRAHTSPDDRIAVIGSEPEIYFYADRRAAVSYMYTYPLMEAHPFARRMQEDLIAQLERERPRYLVLVNVDTSWLLAVDSDRLLLEWARRTVDAEYDLVGLIDVPSTGEAVYHWDDAARTAQPRTASYVAVFRRRG